LKETVAKQEQKIKHAEFVKKRESKEEEKRSFKPDEEQYAPIELTRNTSN
jgi:hypothetical protein